VKQRLVELGEQITADIGTDIKSRALESNELILVADYLAIVRVLSYLKASEGLQFSQLMDLCGVDYLGRTPRFDVVYNLLSLKYNCRIRVKVQVDEGMQIPSATAVYNSAGWYEREVFDLYGIPFADHPDLRRILTDYDFEGYPLRKDFPLSGYVEMRYDESKKRVVYEPVKLPQAFRNFDFESPWEGMVNVAHDSRLPGDEKADTPEELCS
jgi:NADH-quinone oxidoreductase subunit C